MSLIPIPKEKVIRIVHYKNQTVKHDLNYNLLNSASSHLQAYLENDNDFDLPKVNKLIHKLERSILVLQKQKQKLVQNKHQKLPKKK